MEEKKFIIIGGKWFDKVNGNTYHNAKIIDADTGATYYAGYAYGYGSAYLSSGENFIKANLKINNFKIIDGGNFYLKQSLLKKGWF